MERLSMRKIREVLRLSLACGLSTPVLGVEIRPEMRDAHTWGFVFPLRCYTITL